jgi:HNH endonuclease
VNAEKMTANRRKKLQLFRLGAAAVARLSPGRVDQYACPLCRTLWVEDAIDAGMVTLEHVPPASMGGKGIVLTCERCNSPAGGTIDAAVRHRMIPP